MTVRFVDFEVRRVDWNWSSTQRATPRARHRWVVYPNDLIVAVASCMNLH